MAADLNFASFQDVTTESPTRYLVVENPRLAPGRLYRIRTLDSATLTRLRIMMWSAKPEDLTDVKLEQDRQIFAACVVDADGQRIVPTNQEELIPLSAVNSWVIVEARRWAGLDVSFDESVRTEEKN